MRGLTGKVVVVAGGRLGSARPWLAVSAPRVGRLAINGDNALAAAAEVRDGGASVSSSTSATTRRSALVAAAISEFGGLDAMHANAADLSPGARLRRVPSRSRCSTARSPWNLRGHGCAPATRSSRCSNGRWRDRLHQLRRRAHRRIRATVVRGGEDQLAGAPRWRRVRVGRGSGPTRSCPGSSSRRRPRWPGTPPDPNASPRGAPAS